MQQSLKLESMRKKCQSLTLESTSENSATEFNFIVYEKKIYNRD
jgi:hypothetical protein